MKAFLKLLLIAAIASPVVACQKSDNKRGSIRTQRTARGAPYVRPETSTQGLPQPGVQYPTQPGAPSGGRTWGAVHGGNGRISEVEFDARIHDFVAATMNPMELGSVSGQIGAQTGVRFWGFVEPQGTRFNPMGMGSANISSTNSELRMVIWDSYAGMIDVNGELIPEYPVHIKGNAVGQIQGNNADIYFQDQYGWIRFYGTFDSQYFYGRVYFDNTNGWANDMGDFYIPTCSFFRCN